MIAADLLTTTGSSLDDVTTLARLASSDPTCLTHHDPYITTIGGSR
jgi:hypothetical protein